MKGTPEHSFAFSTVWRHREKSWTEKEPSADNKYVSALVLEFPPPRNVRNKFPLFISHLVYDILLCNPRLRYTQVTSSESWQETESHLELLEWLMTRMFIGSWLVSGAVSDEVFATVWTLGKKTKAITTTQGSKDKDNSNWVPERIFGRGVNSYSHCREGAGRRNTPPLQAFDLSEPRSQLADNEVQTQVKEVAPGT